MSQSIATGESSGYMEWLDFLMCSKYTLDRSIRVYSIILSSRSLKVNVELWACPRRGNTRVRYRQLHPTAAVGTFLVCGLVVSETASLFFFFSSALMYTTTNLWQI